MSSPTGASTPGWVIWLIVVGVIGVIVCGAEASKRSGPGGSPSPAASVR